MSILSPSSFASLIVAPTKSDVSTTPTSRHYQTGTGLIATGCGGKTSVLGSNGRPKVLTFVTHGPYVVSAFSSSIEDLELRELRLEVVLDVELWRECPRLMLLARLNVEVVGETAPVGSAWTN